MIETEDGQYAIYERDLMRSDQFLIYGTDAPICDANGRQISFCSLSAAKQFVAQHASIMKAAAS
jgi:hypothetical protein